MPKVCSMCCFICVHPDCINDEPPTQREIAIIEADDRYVRFMQKPFEERLEILERRAKQRREYRADSSVRLEYRRRSKEKQREYLRQWREKRRKGET